MEKETKEKEVKEQGNKALIKVGITLGDINGVNNDHTTKKQLNS